MHRACDPDPVGAGMNSWTWKLYSDYVVGAGAADGADGCIPQFSGTESLVGAGAAVGVGAVDDAADDAADAQAWEESCAAMRRAEADWVDNGCSNLRFDDLLDDCQF